MRNRKKFLLPLFFSVAVGMNIPIAAADDMAVQTEFMTETESQDLDVPAETEKPELPDQGETETEAQIPDTQPDTEPETVEETEATVREPETNSEIITETEGMQSSETVTENGEKEETADKEREVFFETVESLKEESAIHMPEISEMETPALNYGTGAGNYYWDPSWYIEGTVDFRFVQVEKEYAIAEPGNGEALIYEKASEESEVVGSIPFYGLVYILADRDADFVYVESGGVRGFVRNADIVYGEYADTVVAAVGEDGFVKAQMTCPKYENAAYTYTQTTVYEVVAAKSYAITVKSGAIQEQPTQSARVVGTTASGNLCYILEDADSEWVYVESGDVRGFIPAEELLTGSLAESIVSSTNEAAISLAEEKIKPEDNKSCYYTLKSVRVASGVYSLGEKIAQCAQSYVGKLKYVWGGTSLSTGADCSGFTQSVYAQFGINIPRQAEQQGMSGMVVQNVGEALPGDIVYYASGPHVGIYIGAGLVVQCNGDSYNTAANPGTGPMISPINFMAVTSIRRYIIERNTAAGTRNCRTDSTGYTQEQMELIWAIVAQEDNGSYEGALAVISSAMNRTESPSWSKCGSNALMQLTASGQYSYSLDNYWKRWLGGNVPDYVKEAVEDCLKLGIRNHSYTCFRSSLGSQTGSDAVQIGGNWFFET